MITPAFSLTATERVLPKLALDFTTASLDPRVTFTRTGSVATRINASGVIETMAADTPRFDFNPITLACNGLLIEEARTNLFNYSQALDNVYWSKTRLNVTGTPAWVDQAISPDGTQNADKLIEDTSTNTHFIQRTYAAAASTTYTYSVFLKAGERTFALVQVGLFANQVASNVVNINLTTGEFTASDVNRTRVQNFGNGWWRVSTTVTTIASAVNIAPSVYVASALGTTSYTGDGTSGIFAWGAQLEVGAFATSYIPTEATALTRNADVATMTGANFSDWFNASEGTFVAEASSNDITTNIISRIVEVNTSSTDRMYLGYAPITQTTSYQVRTASVTQAGANMGAVTAYSTFKVSMAYEINSFTAAVNGTVLSTDTSGTVPTVNVMYLGSSNGTNVLNGYLKSVNYYSQRLLNAECAAFTN